MKCQFFPNLAMCKVLLMRKFGILSHQSISDSTASAFPDRRLTGPDSSSQTHTLPGQHHPCTLDMEQLDTFPDHLQLMIQNSERCR